MSKRILFTGGGTAGHVTPNIALIEALQAKQWTIHYVGSQAGIERQLIEPLAVPFHGIKTGKLRRYFSWQNFIDPGLIAWGFLQSLLLCLRLRPNVVFSKGGFVAVPLVVAAWVCRIPVISHESDMTPGLANRLCFPFSRWICVNFPQTATHLPTNKVLVTGSPVRTQLLNGDSTRARAEYGLAGIKPLLLVFGGSLGANVINRVVRQSLNALLDQFDLIHVVGAGNLDESLTARAGYIQREYIHGGFGDVLAAADLVLSRAGANSIYELLITRTPHILVPLSAAASRGDQLINARTFQQAGMSEVLYEDQLSEPALLECIHRIYAQRKTIEARLSDFKIHDSVAMISALIHQAAEEKTGGVETKL